MVGSDSFATVCGDCSPATAGSLGVRSSERVRAERGTTGCIGVPYV